MAKAAFRLPSARLRQNAAQVYAHVPRKREEGKAPKLLERLAIEMKMPRDIKVPLGLGQKL